jgi:hypothetical protein
LLGDPDRAERSTEWATDQFDTDRPDTNEIVGRAGLQSGV